MTSGYLVNWYWGNNSHKHFTFVSQSINKTCCTSQPSLDNTAPSSTSPPLFDTKLNHILWIENSCLNTDACVCHHKQKLRLIYYYYQFCCNQAIWDKFRGWWYELTCLLAPSLTPQIYALCKFEFLCIYFLWLLHKQLRKDQYFFKDNKGKKKSSRISLDKNQSILIQIQVGSF